MKNKKKGLFDWFIRFTGIDQILKGKISPEIAARSITWGLLLGIMPVAFGMSFIGILFAKKMKFNITIVSAINGVMTFVAWPLTGWILYKFGIWGLLIANLIWFIMSFFLFFVLTAYFKRRLETE